MPSWAALGWARLGWAVLGWAGWAGLGWAGHVYELVSVPSCKAGHFAPCTFALCCCCCGFCRVLVPQAKPSRPLVAQDLLEGGLSLTPPAGWSWGPFAPRCTHYCCLRLPCARPCKGGPSSLTPWVVVPLPLTSCVGLHADTFSAVS